MCVCLTVGARSLRDGLRSTWRSIKLSRTGCPLIETERINTAERLVLGFPSSDSADIPVVVGLRTSTESVILRLAHSPKRILFGSSHGISVRVDVTKLASKNAAESPTREIDTMSKWEPS